MSYRIFLVLLCLPCSILLAHWAYDAQRCFDEADFLAFGSAVAGMVVSVAILEAGLWFAGELWQEEMAKRPPAKPVPPDLAVAFWWAIVIGTQVMALGMFLTTMDGGLRWAAARWAYLGYAVPALVLAAARWGRWAWPERLFLRWGWAPVLASGVPLALPRLLAAGLITNPWD